MIGDEGSSAATARQQRAIPSFCVVVASTAFALWRSLRRTLQPFSSRMSPHAPRVRAWESAAAARSLVRSLLPRPRDPTNSRAVIVPQEVCGGSTMRGELEVPELRAPSRSPTPRVQHLSMHPSKHVQASAGACPDRPRRLRAILRVWHAG